MKFNKYCNAVFGSNIEASDDASVTNNMQAWTKNACLALSSAGNIQGSHKCFKITTSFVVKQHII